jgi:asparagine synthase (glutamine-hydrolysing)
VQNILSALQEIGRSAHADTQAAEAFGVELHHPYTDASVVDAYLSVPVTAFPSPSRYKPVLAQAMGDLFPPDLRRRTTKGSWSADHHRGLRRMLPRIRRLMDDGHLYGHGLLDPRAFEASLINAALGLDAPLTQVGRTVAMEMWLRALADAPPIARHGHRVEAHV